MTRALDLTATLDLREALAGVDFVTIATPTNYDVDTDKFDTSSVESVIQTVLDAGRQSRTKMLMPTDWQRSCR